MAAESITYSPPLPPSIEPRSGFSNLTRTFHSLRPAIPLPPLSEPLSYVDYAFSLLHSPLLPSNPALVDATTGLSLSYPDFVSRVRSLILRLQAQFQLSKGDVAFVLSPSNVNVPILYFALLALGAVVSPGNPISTPSEIARQFKLVSPKIAFTTSATASKIPKDFNGTNAVVILDDGTFDVGTVHTSSTEEEGGGLGRVEIMQTDPAAIMFSSGTTGRVKAAAAPHRSFIAMTAGFYSMRCKEKPERMLLVAPMFHSLGFYFILRGLAMGETTVVMSKVGFSEILDAAARYRVTMMTASPPVVVGMGRAKEVDKYDLRALERVLSGGAPLSEDAAERFTRRFPHVELRQGYGSTEAGGISRMINREECKKVRSAGRLTEHVEAKVVDIVTGTALSVGQEGELWIRGPALMIGYVGDEEANACAFDSEGWLKTGDLCYFDNDGFLHVVDRLKELIKYKAYQVPPAELEHLLHSLADVVEAAVIPFPQEEVGEIPMAFVVRQPGSTLNEHQVMDYVAAQVAPYKKIRKVVFVSSIPKSAAGKILRRELAAQALCNSSPMSRL
uniref:4-coumarate--CoA ligase n=1 Tax=Narcissus papyraceus TaxID=54854 RepID=A0A346TLE9_NARPA|nr:4-coumarate-CoA ligase 2 [Narcissus papyraceus]